MINFAKRERRWHLVVCQRNNLNAMLDYLARAWGLHGLVAEPISTNGQGQPSHYAIEVPLAARVGEFPFQSAACLAALRRKFPQVQQADATDNGRHKGIDKTLTDAKIPLKRIPNENASAPVVPNGR